MKISLHILMASLFANGICAQTGNVGIGTSTPASSAALDITASDRGLLLPRLTTAEIYAIADPQEGLLVYNNSTFRFWGYQRYDSVVTGQTLSNNGYPLYGNSPVIGQSFTTPIATILTGIELSVANNTNSVTHHLKVDLFSGSGYFGSPLCSDTLTIPTGFAYASYLFSMPLAIQAVANEEFSLRAMCLTCGGGVQQSVEVAFQSATSDPYAGGKRLNASGSPISGMFSDLFFRMHGYVIGWKPLQIIEND